MFDCFFGDILFRKYRAVVRKIVLEDCELCWRTRCRHDCKAGKGANHTAALCLLRGGVGLEYDLVLLGLHCFLRLAHSLYCHSG